MMINGQGRLHFEDDDGITFDQFNGSSGNNNGLWHHFVIVRNGAIFKLMWMEILTGMRRGQRL